MALHSKGEMSSNRDAQIFGSGFLSSPLPKYTVPIEGTDPAAATSLFTMNCCLTVTPARM